MALSALDYLDRQKPLEVPFASLKSQLNDQVQTVPDTAGHLKLLVELTKDEQQRMVLLTQRLGIRHPDDIIRYCIAQVTWWVLSGPMSGASLPSGNDNSVSLQGNSSISTDRNIGVH